MLRNYFKTIIRQIRKEREFSIINVLGLAIGMAACLVIAQFVFFHSTFDRFHENSENIYRLTAEATKNGEVLGEAIQVSGILAKTAAEQHPNVLNYARFRSLGYMNASIITKSEHNKAMADVDDVFATDQSAFDMFDFSFIAGSAEKFAAPNKAIMTESTARQHFNDFQKAIGTNFTFSGNNGEQEFELVGIIKDLPKKTHFAFDLLFSMPSIDRFTEGNESWTSTNFYAYLLTSDDFDQHQFLSEVDVLHTQNGAPRLAEIGYEFKHSLQRLEDIHLYSENGSDFSRPMQANIVKALAIIGITILVIAWINYLNLGLVRTMERLKEVGIRKSLGSNTRQITMLFLLEALFLNFCAFIIAITMVQLASPYIANLTGLEFNALLNPSVTFALVGLVLAGTVLIGIYPAAVSNRFNISGILMGTGQHKIGGLTFRQILVGFQFLITFLLVAGTLVVEKQISFMKSADLGFNVNDIMVIQAPPGDINSDDRQDMVSYNGFKNELLRQSGIQLVVNAGEIPGEPISWTSSLIRLENQSEEESIQTCLVSMGLGFTDFLGLKTIAGRPLQQGDDPWTKGDVVINKKMAEMLGFKNPEDAIGAKITGFYVPIQVRGVLENHHHNSLHHDFDPIIYILSSWTEYYFIKFDVSDELNQQERYAQVQGLISDVEHEWDKFFDFEMDYFFLDSYFNRQYNDDERFGNIFSAFSGLAIFIACLGLFGLTSFTIKQRTKEIGIRKVLGATAADLIILLSRSYVWIIIISYTVAMPIVWYVLNQWLENYTFRIDLGWWLLVVPLALVLLIASSTILAKMLRATRLNPVKSLRYE